MSGTWKDRKMYFMKQLWKNTDICFYDGNYGFTVPSWFKKMRTRIRRAKIKDAMKYAGIKDQRTFRNWLKSGLPHSRLPSGTVLIRYSDIDRWLEGFQVKESASDELNRIVDDVLEGMKL